MAYNRTIKFAFDEKSGEVIEAEQVFDTAKNSFLVRKQFHRDEIQLHCCECGQKLNVSTSKYDRLHFKHQPGHQSCLLSDGELSPKDIDQIARFFISKESERHKELKKKIAALLASFEDVDAASIAVDNRFISDGVQKRKPDVYCRFRDKDLVFEIQLSDLSLRYIYSRYNFYKANGMYLVWILDKFDLKSQSQLVRDIKYLTKYENFFKLDESESIFRMLCQYKYPFLTDNNQLLTKWLTKSVSLNDLTFDDNIYQVYYYNFAANKLLRESEQERKAEQIRQKEEDDRNVRARKKAEEIIAHIRTYRKNGWQNFGLIRQNISELDVIELKVLADRLNVRKKDEFEKPALNYWISTATREDSYFLYFLLDCKELHLEVNQKDKFNKSALQEVYSNDSLPNKMYIVQKLFARDYKFTDADQQLLQNRILQGLSGEIEMVTYELSDRLADRSLIHLLSRSMSVMYILESAKRRKFVWYNYRSDQWPSFGINAIQHYARYWNYIEAAFKVYGVWDTIIAGDRKGTFLKKLTSLYEKYPAQEFDIDPLVDELYPEIIEDGY